MLKYITPFFILAAFVSSCSKSTSTSTPPSDIVKANTGSTFTYDEYSTDSTNAIIVGSRDTMICTILQTSGYMGGKSGVLFVEEKRVSNRDTAYYSYESNNNLSVYVNPSDPSLPIWETVPTGTGVTIIRPTTYSFIGIDTTVVNDSTITSLVGTENMIIKGQSVSVKKMQLSFRHATWNSGGGALESKIDNFLYYAPSLGFIAKTSSVARPDPFGGWIEGSSQTLIDYTLK
jgi:hypothetical protein